MNTTSDTGDGDCFQVAFDLCAKEGLTLVHGIPLGTGGEALGKRYWHAWCETADGYVIDASNGKGDKPARLPRELYYLFGKIEHTWRYDILEAQIIASIEGHYGPWETAP